MATLIHVSKDEGQKIYTAVERSCEAGEFATAFHIIEDNALLLKWYINEYDPRTWEEFLNELEGNRLNESAWHSFPVQSFERFAK